MFDDKQTIVNPLYGTDEANEAVSGYILSMLTCKILFS